MGIKGLTKLLSDNAPGCMREQKFENYFGRKVAIDASMSIYSFLVLGFVCLVDTLVVVGRVGSEMLTNEAGEVTSHLQGMFTRTIRLMESGMKPVFVFDGKPPQLKSEELKKRYTKREGATEDLAKAVEEGKQEDIEKYSKRTVKVTRQHNEDCRKLLRLMGVPVVEAPSEAEAECASLCKSGKVYAVASEDMDSLTFGSPKFVRHLMEPSARKIPVMEFDIAKALEELQLSMDAFIDLCILCGCDYCETIPRIGPQTALKLIRQHTTLEGVLASLDKSKYQIPDPWPFEAARVLFKTPEVTPPEEHQEFKWTSPDEAGLLQFLVTENGFNNDRIVKAIEKIKTAKTKSSQGRLESFFKAPTPDPNAASKRKEPPAAKGGKGGAAKGKPVAKKGKSGAISNGKKK